MNTNNTEMCQQKKVEIAAAENMEPQINQKRKRSDKDDCKITNEQQSQNNKRPTKSIFRPWCDETSANANLEKKKIMELPQTSQQQTPAPIASYYTAQPSVPQHQAPVFMSAYQMALQQQQRQTAMAMQQAAMYQRQVFMAHMWARQQQQQQQQHHQHQMQMQQQQMQQQMFAYGPQQH